MPLSLLDQPAPCPPPHKGRQAVPRLVPRWSERKDNLLHKNGEFTSSSTTIARLTPPQSSSLDSGWPQKSNRFLWIMFSRTFCEKLSASLNYIRKQLVIVHPLCLAACCEGCFSTNCAHQVGCEFYLFALISLHTTRKLVSDEPIGGRQARENHCAVLSASCSCRVPWRSTRTWMYRFSPP